MLFFENFLNYFLGDQKFLLLFQFEFIQTLVKGYWPPLSPLSPLCSCCEVHCRKICKLRSFTWVWGQEPGEHNHWLGWALRGSRVWLSEELYQVSTPWTSVSLEPSPVTVWCVIFTEIFLLVLKCVEITLTDDTACSLYKRFKDKQRQCNSVTGSQYFVARECRNNLIILSRVPDSRQSSRTVMKNNLRKQWV